MAGSAVATMVWSATAMNIGSMIDGKTVQNSRRGDGAVLPSATAWMPGASAAPPEMSSALEWVIRDFSEKSLRRKLFRMSHGRPHALQQWHICGRRMQQMHGRGSERLPVPLRHRCARSYPL